jgi:HD-GYP domain-containing protein (c-di-GMP phosphodiesterase class II)
VRDAQADERVADWTPRAARTSAPTSACPIPLPDGSTYGTFCCVSHHRDPTLRERDLRFMAGLARMIGDQLHRDELQAQRHRVALNEAHVRALLAALEARDGYTEEHSHAVVEMALLVGRRARTWPPSTWPTSRSPRCCTTWGSWGSATRSCASRARLTDEEWEEMRRHPEIGARIVAGMHGLSHLAEVVRAEHERWDGRGYPDGLAGEEIPRIARIVLVCDAFHAMTSDRPYRTAMAEEAAVRELHAAAGSQLCPSTVRAALRVIDGARAAA